MIDYQATIPFTVGAFPNTVGQNATGAGATDGTPWIKAVIDDLWGSRQVKMDRANLVPSGLTENIANGSQELEAIMRICGYPGEVICWAGQDNASGTYADPSSEDIRLLEMTGQGVLIANYPDLDAVVYCGNAANPTQEAFYHSSDAPGVVRNVAGPYLQLPDNRGRALRGFDPTFAIDDPYNTEEGKNREIGSLQHTAVAAHCHEIHYWDGAQYDGVVYPSDLIYNAGDSPSDIFKITADPADTDLYARDMESTQCDYNPGFSLFESRMHNLAFRICIRY